MISNCDLHVYVRDVLDLPEDASNEALVDAVNNLYVQYRDLKDELGVPYWAYHNEVLDEIRNLTSSRDRYNELVRALGLKEYAGHNDVLDHIKSLQGGGATEKLRADVRSLTQFMDSALEIAAEQHKDLCQALGLDQGRTRQDILDRIRSERQALAGAGVLHIELCEVLGLDPEASNQQVVDKVQNLLRDTEKSRDFWRQEADRLQGVINRAKEALDD